MKASLLLLTRADTVLHPTSRMETRESVHGVSVLFPARPATG